MKRFQKRPHGFADLVARQVQNIVLFFVPALLFCKPAVAQNMDCIKEMMIPRYNLSSRRSVTGGTVAVSVLVGADARPARIDTGTSDSDLAEEVRNYLLHETTYSESCTGKIISLKFTFELQGEAEWDPPVFVKFRPPNHFIITSRPRKPNVH